MKLQHHRLNTILRANGQTQFGRQYRFTEINSVEAFQSRVPLQCYDDVEPWIGKILQGEQQVLTRDPVLRLMPSSGSAQARKLLPYTRTLQREFDLGISPWIANLFLTHPGLMGGRAYWSISPKLPTETVDNSQYTIGFEQDADYLGGWKSFLVSKLLAVNPNISEITDIQDFRYQTLLNMLRCTDLTLISVWHPSFLILLLKALESRWESLLKGIKLGSQYHSQSNLVTPPDIKRWRTLVKLQPTAITDIWPSLRLISCWGDGHARESLAQLKQLIPAVNIQNKGLVATEAFVSIPIQTKSGTTHPLSIGSHFYEFIDGGGQIHTADKVKLGAEYELVVTTGGGLYRYRLGDKVAIAGSLENTPCIRFVGRVDSVSDYYGEKLQDDFVARCLDHLFKVHRLQPIFSMLAPDGESSVRGYTLLIEYKHKLPGKLGMELDQYLCENPHYAWCRKLGQLGPPRVFIITNGHEQYLQLCSNQGAELGAIKPLKLYTFTHWRAHIAGTYI